MFGPAVARPKKRLLVVDDDDDYRDILAHFLAVRYEVVTAQDGIEGLEQASRLPPDLIITDVAMPRLGGIAMVHHLRASFGLWVPVFFSERAGCADRYHRGYFGGRAALPDEAHCVPRPERAAHSRAWAVKVVPTQRRPHLTSLVPTSFTARSRGSSRHFFGREWRLTATSVFSMTKSAAALMISTWLCGSPETFGTAANTVIAWSFATERTEIGWCGRGTKST